MAESVAARAGTAPAAPAAMAGGPPRFFSLAAVDVGTVLAGTCGRGISRSADGGVSWTAAKGMPGSGWVNCFASAGTVVLAGTAETGVYRSGDGGQSWEPAGLDGCTVFALCLAGGVVLVGTEANGVLASTDGGGQWRPVEGIPTDVPVYRIVPLGSGAVLVGTAGEGAWLLDDATSTLGRPAGLDRLTIYSAVEVAGGRLLAGTREAGLHRSDDRETWVSSGEGLPDPVVHSLLAEEDGSLLAGTGLGVARSVDGGERWAPFAALADRRIFSLARSPAGRRFAGSYDGVWAAERTSSEWSPVDTGLSEDAFAAYVDAQGMAFAGTAAGAVLRSVDAGATWDVVGEGLGSIHAFLRLSSGQVLAALDGGVVLAAEEVWDWQPLGLTGERALCLLEPEPSVVLAGTVGTGLYRSTGDLRAWEAVEASPHNMALDLLPAGDGHVVLATGAVVNGVKTGGIARSTDGGATWAPAAAPAITVYLLVRLSSGTLVAAAQRSQILRSTDGGATWQLVATTGLAGAKVYALTVDSDDRLYLGAGMGIARSDDGGDTWVKLDTPSLDGVTVFDLAAHPAGSLVAATSAGVLTSFDAGTTWHAAIGESL